eukprot:Awhi_evm1s7138
MNSVIELLNAELSQSKSGNIYSPNTAKDLELSLSSRNNGRLNVIEATPNDPYAQKIVE